MDSSAKVPPSRPCRSPYCECDVGACRHEGHYDARGSYPASQSLTRTNFVRRVVALIVFNDPDQYIFVSASHRLGWDYGMEQWEMEALAECLGVPVDAVYACDTVGDLYNL